MSAVRHVHPDQLRMLIPAGELADPEKFDHYHTKYDPNTTFDAVRKQKLREAATGREYDSRLREKEGGPTLRESIAEHGVRKAVDLMTPGYDFITNADSTKYMLGEGHHRVFTAADLDPTMEIPVRYRGD